MTFLYIPIKAPFFGIIIFDRDIIDDCYLQSAKKGEDDCYLQSAKSMNTIENQKIIIISKDKIKDGQLYTVITLDALDDAAVLLKNASFKLWIYLAKNQDKYRFGLSQTAFCNWASISKPTYLNAVKDLIEKGYLVLKEKNLILIFFMNVLLLKPSLEQKKISLLKITA